MLQSGDVLSGNKAVWKVLSPSDRWFYGNENDASLVLYLEHENFCGLFMGDAGTVAEAEIIKMGIQDITLLKVAHHGSGIGTNSEEFISFIKPGIAVISCGRNNSYGHPHEEVTERLTSCGSSIYRTDIDGQISVIIRGRQVRINER